MEAVFIKRNLFITLGILLISFVAISGCSFATDTNQTTINGNVYTTAQIEDATNRVNTFQETNNRLPSYVTISGQKIPINDFLPYMEQNTNPTNEGNGNTGTVINGITYTNTQIQDATNRVNTFKQTYNRLPSYVTISGQKIPINDFLPYMEQNTNPTNGSNPTNGGNTSGTTFTSSQINSAATTVKKFYDTNNRLPSYVTINNIQITLPQFLQLMTQNILNINSGITSSISLATVNSPSSATETLKIGNLYKTEYINIAKSIDTYIDTNGKAPNYVSSSLGNMKFETMVYTFSKILNYKAANNRLPNFVSAAPWNDNTSTSSNGFRPVYVISDNINNKIYDNNRIDLLVNALKSLGLTAYNYGAGTDNYAIFSMVPSNALVVQINGGVCAGTIKDMGSAYYKDLVGSREVFMVFTEGATKITGLAWMPRSYDDNFSPASFTGLANPDQYLINNGYNFYEGYTNSQVNTLAQIIYQEASD